LIYKLAIFPLYLTSATARPRPRSGNFDCLDDKLSPDPISVALYDSQFTALWQSKPGESEGIFSHLGSGRHQLCISNGIESGDDIYGMYDGLSRTVGFSIRVVPLQPGEEGEGPGAENTSRLIEMSSSLMTWLSSMLDHQDYMRNREAVHRDLTEATFRRVVRWTLLEAFVLVLVSSGQVIYLKKFFEQRRYL